MDRYSDTKIEIVIEAQGNLRIQGWDRSSLQMQLAGGGSTTVELSGPARIACPGDAFVLVPRNGDLVIGDLPGDLDVAGVMGSLTLRECGGSVDLRSIGPSRLGGVAGSLHVRDAKGQVEAGRVDGSAYLDRVDGGVNVTAHGDLHLQEVSGSVKAEAGGAGDVILTPSATCSYECSARGTLHCRIPEDANATVILLSETGETHVSVPGGQPSVEGHATTIALGKGKPEVRLRGNSVTLSAIPPEGAGGVLSTVEAAAGQLRARVQHTREQIIGQLEERIAALPDEERRALEADERLERVKATIETAFARAERHTESVVQDVRRRVAAYERPRE